ncbi:MAG TPA: PfkB family carbohydrate kinase [Candidatus Limnocylindria bacterium]|nr:PfkB family carbohydrate kinase [Candidatus Limnocylindria bacterium]
MSLLVVGSVAYDSIKTPFGEEKRALGGSATYFSLAASFFTAPALVAVVGEDFLADDEKLFSDHGIDISGLQRAAGKTFAWGGEYSFDLNSRTSLFTELNVFENFKPILLPAHKEAEYVFLANIHPSLQKEVLTQIKKPRLVGLDTMNYWIENAPHELAEILKLVNVLVINDSEARELTKEHNLLKAAKKILAMMPAEESTLIIKRGEYGLLMLSQAFPKSEDSKDNMTIFNLPGYPLEDVVDPTGAGDSFAGGLFGYLAQTHNISWENLKKACVAGSIMGSFCVEKMGTKRLVNLTRDEIEERIKNFKKLTHFEA